MCFDPATGIEPVLPDYIVGRHLVRCAYRHTQLALRSSTICSFFSLKSASLVSSSIAHTLPIFTPFNVFFCSLFLIVSYDKSFSSQKFFSLYNITLIYTASGKNQLVISSNFSCNSTTRSLIIGVVTFWILFLLKASSCKTSLPQVVTINEA